MLKRNNWSLIIILLIALVLRLIGANHDFPFILHPDEPTVVRSALGLRFNLNPGHFDWPHLFIYLNYFIYLLFAKFRDLLVYIGLKESISHTFPLLWNDNLVFYLLSRLFEGLLGAVTILPVYFIGKELFSKKAGLLGALAMTFMPYHIRTSHFSLIDVPMVFFFTWSVYFSILIYKFGKLKHFILAGLFCGFAASTKYNGGLIAPLVPLAMLFAIKVKNYSISIKMALISLFLSGLFAFIGFVMGTPFSILDYFTFSRTDGPNGAYWQFTNVGKVSLVTQVNQFVEVTFYRLSKDTGYTYLLVFWLGFVYLLVRRKKENKFWELLLIYIPSIFLMFYISGFEKTRSHYYLFTYPLIASLIGYYASLASKRWHYLLITLLFIVPIIVSISEVNRLIQTPQVTRETDIYGGDSKLQQNYFKVRGL